MNVLHDEAQAPSSLIPKCLQPYFDSIENVGIIVRNITQTGVVISEVALNAAELSNAMILRQLEEVSAELTARPRLA
jgi:hypothetical protein